MDHDEYFQRLQDVRTEIQDHIDKTLDARFPDKRPHCLLMLATGNNGDPMAVATETVGHRATLLEMLAFATQPEPRETNMEKLCDLAVAGLRLDALEADAGFFILVRASNGETCIKSNLTPEAAQRALEQAGGK